MAHFEGSLSTIKVQSINIVGEEKFSGQRIHSHSYKSHVGYEDKRVIVIGVGNSGGDIAVELSRISKQVEEIVIIVVVIFINKCRCIW